MRIHQVWIGSEDIPERYKYFSERIKDMHKEWEHIFWDNEKIEEEFKNDEILLSLKDQTESSKVNYIRFVLLKRYGGFYIDVDVEPVTHLYELLDSEPDFIIGRQPEGRRFLYDIGVIYSKKDGDFANKIMARVNDFTSGGKCLQQVQDVVLDGGCSVVDSDYFYSQKIESAKYLHSKYYGSWRTVKNKEELF